MLLFINGALLASQAITDPDNEQHDTPGYNITTKRHLENKNWKKIYIYISYNVFNQSELINISTEYLDK